MGPCLSLGPDVLGYTINVYALSLFHAVHGGFWEQDLTAPVSARTSSSTVSSSAYVTGGAHDSQYFLEMRGSLRVLRRGREPGTQRSRQPDVDHGKSHTGALVSCPDFDSNLDELAFPTLHRPLRKYFSSLASHIHRTMQFPSMSSEYKVNSTRSDRMRCSSELLRFLIHAAVPKGGTDANATYLAEMWASHRYD